MSTIVTRSGKGSPLTHAEMDANVTNLNTDKLESTVTQDLTIKTSDGGILKLQTSHDTIEDGDVLGAIEFSAPDESDDTDARTTAASIVAEANDTFATDANEADLVFKLGDSGTATEVMRLTESSGNADRTELILTLDNAGNLYGPVLTFNRVSTSPSDDDRGGQLLWKFENDANETIDWSYIRYIFTDVSDGSEDGKWEFVSKVDGTNTDALILTGNSATFGGSVVATQLSGTLQTAAQPNITSVGTLTGLNTSGDIYFTGDTGIFFEGSTNDAHEVYLRATDATADRSIRLPDASGRVLVQDFTTHDVTIKADVTGSGVDPAIILHKNDTNNGADGDGVAAISFKGTNNSGGEHVFGFMQSGVVTATAGSEEGNFRISVAGSNTSFQNEAYAGGNGIIIHNDHLEIKGDILAKTSDGAILKLQTSDTSVEDGDYIGEIRFSSPNEADGFDAVQMHAAIVAEADATFAADNNQTDFVFKLGSSETATEKMRLHHEGNLSLGVDTDVGAEIGRAHIGYVGYADIAGFSHIDQNGTSTYALLQAGNGTTYLNSASGTGIYLRNNNSDVAQIGDLGLYLYPNKSVIFEGSSANSNETFLNAVDPTADRTISLPDATGTVHLNDDSFGRTLIVATTFSNTSNIDINSSFITDTYNTYDVMFTNVHSDTDNVALRCRMGDSDSAITSAAYSYIGQMRGTKGMDSSEIANYADNEETYMAITPNDSDFYLGTGSSENFNCHLRFFNLRETNLAKGFEVISGAYRSSDQYWVSWYQGIGFDHDNFANKRNFITFFLSSGNFASGFFRVYGLNL